MLPEFALRISYQNYFVYKIYIDDDREILVAKLEIREWICATKS